MRTDATVDGATRVVAAYELLGASAGAATLVWTLASVSVTDSDATLRVAVPLGYLPLVVFLLTSAWAGLALWRGVRGGLLASVLILLVQLVQLNLPGLQCYLSCPLGLYVTFPTDERGSVDWAGLLFEVELGLKYGLGAAEAFAPAFIRFNVLALGLMLYLLFRALELLLPEAPSSSSSEQGR